MNESRDPVDIRNWQRRSDRITTSGKLKPDDPARLAAIGVKHVINLALDDHPEALANEAGLLREHGIAYTHIPVPFGEPTREHVEQMRRTLARAAGPVHVHCIMNYRVTAFFYLLDREEGIEEEEARSRMTKVWDPLTSDHPSAGPWRLLISQ